jgi:3-oxoacyl-[acyl-carrier-protein] synthase II
MPLCLLREGDRNVLVGAADEHIDILEDVAANLAFETGSPLTSGASFFVMSKEKTSNTLAVVKDCATIGLVHNVPEKIVSFLTDNGLQASDLDLDLVLGCVCWFK